MRIWPYHTEIWEYLKNTEDAPASDITQRATTIRTTRFKVTICLYLMPNNRERSLSMLIAVIVSKDTENKIKLKLWEATTE